MADTITSFNRLDRPEYAPSGLVRNHWYFTVRHVPLHPAGDMIQIINPESHFQVCTDPKQILSLPTIGAQTDVIVPLLLETFLKGVNRGPDGLPNEADPQVPSFAPFSWGTRSPNLARAVEVKLRALGVRVDLCTVQPGTREQDEAADESWSKMMDLLINNLGTPLPKRASQGRVICGGCKKDSSWFSAGLKKCSRCNTESYCSRDCQKRVWKQHKKACGNSGGTSDGQQFSSTTGQALDPFDYYQKVAHTVPEAKVLADSISLPLPPRGGGLSEPIHRLVITGKDTPQNLQLLLGPNWQSESSEWGEARIEILLDPPVGSPSYAVHNYNGDAALVSSPRPASVEETARVRRVREVQRAIRTRLGARREPTTQDMTAILTSFGENWPAMVPDYQLAVNTMDQGVLVP